MAREKCSTAIDLLETVPYCKECASSLVLKWTKNVPTEIGWYWRRQKSRYEDSPEIDIVYIRKYAGELSIGNYSINSSVESEWAGPLKEPK